MISLTPYDIVFHRFFCPHHQHRASSTRPSSLIFGGHETQRLKRFSRTIANLTINIKPHKCSFLFILFIYFAKTSPSVWSASLCQTCSRVDAACWPLDGEVVKWSEVKCRGCSCVCLDSLKLTKWSLMSATPQQWWWLVVVYIDIERAGHLQFYRLIQLQT